MLKMLNIKGLILTIDAMSCQKSTARQIVKQKGDYLLAIKDNQPTLHVDLKAMFE